ncbi:MAG: HAMP domain-containing histidine kinase [Saprospiraceae bacterium]|nr:HAMP domain-containing histidine kinase [Saprospiraceae bacterium]
MDFAKKYRNSKLLFLISISLLVALVVVWWFNVYQDQKEELENKVSYLWLKVIKEEETRIIEEEIKSRLLKISAGSDTENTLLNSMKFYYTINHEDSLSIPPPPSKGKKPHKSVMPTTSLHKKLDYNTDSLLQRFTPNLEALALDLDSNLSSNKLTLDYSIIIADGTNQAKEKTQKVDNFRITTQHGLQYKLDLDISVKLILSRMWLEFLLGTLVIIIITIAFYYILRSLYQEYKIAQIKEGFVSNIVHELRTPIFTVSAALEALQHFEALKDPKKTQEYLEISKNELDRLAILVERVLNTSFFEQGNINLQRETFNVKHLLETIALSLKLPLEKHSANLIINCPDTELNADKIHITNVLYNLIDNALKYSRENSEITINVLKENSFVRIEVQDNGIGIPTTYKDKIFDKFFRVPTDNQHNVKGYGLGLNYVAEIMRLHQAKIEVESVEGQGTTFILYFETI